MKRCFVALDLAAATRRGLLAAQEQLLRLRRHTEKITAVDAENLHLTLKFLGNTPEAVLAEITTALTTIASQTPRFEAVLAGLSAFPSETQPRAIFARVAAGAAQVAALSALIDRALEPLGFAPDARPRHPHATIARVRVGRRAQTLLAEWIASQASTPYGDVNTASFSLFESQPTARGSVYLRLASFTIGA